MGFPNVNMPVADMHLSNMFLQLMNSLQGILFLEKNHNEKIGDKNSRLFKIPPDATNCLYVDGIPIDAKEREVSRNFLYNQNLRYFPTVSRLPMCEVDK